MKTNNTICLVAGKSAGHILPALTIAQKIKNLNPDTKIVFFSNETKLDHTVLNHNPIINIHIALSLMNLPYKKIWQLFNFSWQLLRAMYKCHQILKLNQPSQIISTGGLIAIPVCLIAKKLKIPIIIYELNVEPGKATKLLAKIATQINICFKKTQFFLPKVKCHLSAYPIRFKTEQYQLSRSLAFDIINQNFPGFNPDNKTLLVLGGSQGSLFINDLIRKVFLNQPQLKIQIIHQTGSQEEYDWSSFYQKYQVPAIVFDYENNLMPYYRAANLIICRAGAGTLAEIAPLNTPCITIPLNTGYTRHQIENALEVAHENPQIKVLNQNEINNNFDLFYTQLIQNLN